MKRLSFLLLALAAATASAQSPAPAPQPPATQAPAPQPSEPKAAAQRPLNLYLDDASLRQITRSVREEPSEVPARGAGGALPSLGGDARRVDPTTLRATPYPRDNGGSNY